MHLVLSATTGCSNYFRVDGTIRNSTEMNRKRDKPDPSRHTPISHAKRRRHLPPDLGEIQPSRLIKRLSAPPPVVVIGLKPDCSVLDLKSRFEIYGSISRIRIDHNGVGNITFRSKESGDAAIAASLDSSFGITLDSVKVQAMWEDDPLCQWRKGITTDNYKFNGSSSSKLLRGEVPLRRHGRGNKLGSAIVNPRADNNISSNSSVLDVPFKGREIVAYDDLL